MSRQLRCAIGFELHECGLWVPTWERAPASASGLLVPRRLADELEAAAVEAGVYRYEFWSTVTLDPLMLDALAYLGRVALGRDECDA